MAKACSKTQDIKICVQVNGVKAHISCCFHLVFLFRHLVECLLDAGKRKEAAAMAKVTSDFIESHKLELYPRLFSIQVNL